MSHPRLFPVVTQPDRLLSLPTRLGENRLLAEYLSGWEALKQGGFSLQLSALSSDARRALEELPGSAAWLELLCDHLRTDLRPLRGHGRRSAFTAIAHDLKPNDGAFQQGVNHE